MGEENGQTYQRVSTEGAWTVYEVGLAGGEVVEGPVDEVGGVDARDDAQRPAPQGAVLDVDVEDSLEPLHPAHGGVGE